MIARDDAPGRPEGAVGGSSGRVTLPASLRPEEAALRLAPRLRGLMEEATRATSANSGAAPQVEGAATTGGAPAPRVPVVTVDGYSGSGKSTLAGALARLSPGWQVLHLDDWYPGWDGLAEGAAVACAIAADLRAGRASSYVAWDWESGCPGERVRVAAVPTIIEGCGALEAAADLAVWIEDPGEAERRRRAIARDGATYEPHWQRWATQDMGRSVN